MSLCFRHLCLKKVHCARCAEVYCPRCHEEKASGIYPLHWARWLLRYAAILAGFLIIFLIGDAIVWVMWALYA